MAEKPFVEIKGPEVVDSPRKGRMGASAVALRARSRYGLAPVHSPSRRLPVVLVTLVLTIAGAALAPAAGAQAPSLHPCPGQGRFGCGTLNVPLDYSGKVPGTIALHFAAQRSFPRTGKILIALTGGPGQPGIDFATPSATSLQPALRGYRLVVLDQRGTGEAGVLRRPQGQALRTLDPFLPQTVAGCAAQVGPRRAFYSTPDTVLDLESLRRALGASKVALMGISYGTHVALQYARAFPQNTDRLVLDSIVGPDGPDAFLLDTYRNLPRVLREQCANNRCAGATADPVADVAALVNRINTAGPLRGRFFDERGISRPTSYKTPDELAFLLIEGDLNPLLQAALPGAIGAARRGDTAELMRLHRIGQGSGTPTADLSFGLNVTTGCLAAPLPYPLATTPISARPAIAQAALAAIPPAQIAPFDPQTVERTSYVDDCLFWPNDAARPQFTSPLPDVPALLLGGRLDTRTPIENALATHAPPPHSTARRRPRHAHADRERARDARAAAALDGRGAARQRPRRDRQRPDRVHRDRDVAVLPRPRRRQPVPRAEQRLPPAALAAAVAERLPLGAGRGRHARARAVRRPRHDPGLDHHRDAAAGLAAAAALRRPARRALPPLRRGLRGAAHALRLRAGAAGDGHAARGRLRHHRAARRPGPARGERRGAAHAHRRDRTPRGPAVHVPRAGRRGRQRRQRGHPPGRRRAGAGPARAPAAPARAADRSVALYPARHALVRVHRDRAAGRARRGARRRRPGDGGRRGPARRRRPDPGGGDGARVADAPRQRADADPR